MENILMIQLDEIAGEIWQCSPELLKTRLRKREVVDARRVVMEYRYIHLGMSQEMAASRYRKNASNLSHALREIPKLVETNAHFRRNRELFIERAKAL